MADVHQIEERVVLEELDVSVLNTLMSGNKVVIPDFGYLELKAIENRRTILFKPITERNGGASDRVNEKEKRKSTATYDKISNFLKAGKVVSLPQVGVFRPIEKADGSFKASFILSGSLRKQLSGEQEAKTEVAIKVKSKAEVTSSLLPHESSPKTDAKVEIVNNGDFIPKKNIRTIEQVQDVKTSKVGDLVVPFKSHSKRKKGDNTVSIMLSIVIFIAVVVAIVGIVAKSRENRNDFATYREQNPDAVNIAKLAEQNYGNAVFWVYIYEANKDKISSPINIPANTYLAIPDILEEFNVNVNDSTEILLAQKKAEVILKLNKK
jgi:nucleoid DNA-binding protein